MWQRCKWAFQTHKNELVSLQPNLSPYVCIVMMTKRSYLIKLWRRLVHTETHDANGATGDNKRPLCAVHGAYRCERRLLINGNDDDLAMTFFFYCAFNHLSCLSPPTMSGSCVARLRRRNDCPAQFDERPKWVGDFCFRTVWNAKKKMPTTDLFFFLFLIGWLNAPRTEFVVIVCTAHLSGLHFAFTA